ncbi:hypothetical protein FA15DRAFT_659338 [Coprinopsis marcescibilis]|uniref:Uncharacterized protein n=1 Tax=Coprinopsis marcescibilis TaxID=230819 RepID=A0A5C3KIV8_COPMA|nr:hypothetical protein FA15DRAFT_659338 [Coprinopsis marcescibilis]
MTPEGGRGLSGTVQKYLKVDRNGQEYSFGETVTSAKHTSIIPSLMFSRTPIIPSRFSPVVGPVTSDIVPSWQRKNPCDRVYGTGEVFTSPKLGWRGTTKPTMTPMCLAGIAIDSDLSTRTYQIFAGLKISDIANLPLLNRITRNTEDFNFTYLPRLVAFKAYCAYGTGEKLPQSVGLKLGDKYY